MYGYYQVSSHALRYSPQYSMPSYISCGDRGLDDARFGLVESNVMLTMLIGDTEQ